jgi:hypothetical protein
MTTWRIWSVVLASAVGAAALIVMLPGVALADNCSSLGDCWSTAAGAASAALGAAVGGLGGLLGGFFGGDGGNGGGGGDGDDDCAPPENEDSRDPNPC